MCFVGIFVHVDFRTNRANPSGVGIDYAASDGGARVEAQLTGSLFTECPSKLTGVQMATVLQISHQSIVLQRTKRCVLV